MEADLAIVVAYGQIIPKEFLSLTKKGFINPVIKKVSDETSIYEEGCLSIPDTFIEIERPKICEVEYIDINGEKKNLKCDGLLSTCLQHEINHLDGKLIIDHLSKLKRDIIIKKISKTKKNPDRILV